MTTEKIIQVAVGLIIDAQKNILTALRPQHVHQGGLWEFPGGKIHKDETPKQALARELLEELGIQLRSADYFMTLPYTYSDLKVVLKIYKVTAYEGEAYGREGQTLAWCRLEELDPRYFPAANRSIITALKLPPYYVITPEPPRTHWQPFIDQFHRWINQGYRLIQLRALHLSTKEYRALANELLAIAIDHQALLLANSDVEWAQSNPAAGLHLNDTLLNHFTVRPIAEAQWLSAACHSLSELQQAEALAVDFVSLSPVQYTQTHPQITPLGWQAWQTLLDQTHLPVYALGGMTRTDLAKVQSMGAVGIAGIRTFC